MSKPFVPQSVDGSCQKVLIISWLTKNLQKKQLLMRHGEAQLCALSLYDSILLSTCVLLLQVELCPVPKAEEESESEGSLSQLPGSVIQAQHSKLRSRQAEHGQAVSPL